MQLATSSNANVIPLPTRHSEVPRGMFDIPGCTITATGLLIDPGMPMDDWIELGKRLKRAGDSVGIWRGDYINYGKHEYGKKYEAALELTGLKEQTLRNDVWISKAVPMSDRSDKLTSKHYRYLAPLKSKRKIRKWIALAVTGGWSAGRLNKEINQTRATTTSSEIDKNYLDPHYKDFLLDYIATQSSFLNRCTYEPFKREIEQTIRRARFQLGRTEKSDYEAFLKEVDSGAATVAEIAEEVPLSESEIEAFCRRAVGCQRPKDSDSPHEAGTDYEWRPIGVKIAKGKGVRPRGIFRKDALSGDAFRVDSEEEDHY